MNKQLFNMQFEFDPERLIEEVRKRPGIWDFEHVDYRAKNLRQKLWNEVVSELLQVRDSDITRSERRELEIQLQKKWKSIRDCFQKYVSNPNRTKRPYLYSKQLQFLLKDKEPMPVQQTNTEYSSSESDSGRKTRKSQKWCMKKKIKIQKENEQQSSDDGGQEVEDINFINTDEMDVSTSKRVETRTGVEEFVYVDAQKTDTEDSDKLFLLSLLPHLKAVPEESRLSVKMQLMEVLQSAPYGLCKDQKIF